ncbi:MAG: ATP-binding protein, partial [Prevotella sp.]|nr:ATP-binding protein [Prevotella sp.]
VADDEQQIPLLESKLVDVRNNIEKESKRQKELKADYDKEKDSLNQDLGGKNSKLKEIAEKRKYFDAINIKEKVALNAREKSLKYEADEKKMLLDDLLKTNASIAEKYNIAKAKLENAHQAFINRLRETLYTKQTELQQERNRYEEERSKNRNLVMNAYRAWSLESKERLHSLTAEQYRADSRLKELRQWHPKEDDIELVKEQLQQLDINEKANEEQQKTVRIQIEKLTNEFEMKEAELKQASLQEQKRLEDNRAICRNEIARINNLLSHLDDSLYHWLCENAEGWEDTIGKVVDEERILYAQGLEPTLDNKTDNLFGVKLNLENIEPTHRTPDEYRAEKKKLEERLQLLNRQLSQLPITLQEEISKLGKKYGNLLKPLRQEATQLRVEANQIPTKRQDLQNQRHKLEMEEQEIISSEQELRMRAFNDATLKVEAEKERQAKNDAKNEKDLKELDAAFNRSVKALNNELNVFQEQQKSESELHNQGFENQKTQLDKQQKAELEGKGVDIKLLNEYHKALDELNKLLQQIETDRNDVIKYEDAVESLFSKEADIRNNIKEIGQRLIMLQQRYEDKRIRIEKKKQAFEDQQRAIQKDLAHRRDGLNQYHQVIENEHLVSNDYLADNKVKSTHLDCLQLISQLRGTINQKREAIEILKGTVVNFNRNFKPQNAFHFNTMPITDADYMQIAVDLQEFIDNNKIEEYRRRTSEHYKDILGRISTEVGALMKRRSDVDGVILDINRDFVEKNFAGVIKSIELRANESSDKLMQLLISIHNYCIENALSIGELNLFSSDNRDEVNRKVVDYLKSLSHQLQNEPNRNIVSLGDAFRLQFRVKENDNDTSWVERINNVGSDGTDILVKAMVNIMLINVFKKKAARKSGDFIVHCMMDEIGRLHPNNIKGILQFANSRNIQLINSSPTSYNPYDYRYTYLLSKHGVKTKVEKLLKRI